MQDLAWRLCLLLPLLVLVPGCGGGGGGDTGGDDETGASPPLDDTVSDTLFSRFFVESFAPFEAAAQHLITQDLRYLRQDIAWFFDTDLDGVQDPASEPTRNTYPLQTAGVHYAHAAGLSGVGQTIGIIDDGFLTGHEAFAGKTIALAGANATWDHGTQVASVAAGQASSMIGVAPGADLVLGSFASFATAAAGTRLADLSGAVALNNSWGFVNTPVGQASYDAVFADATAQDYLVALRDYATDGVVIFAASNDAGDVSAGLMAGLPVIEPGLEAGWLAAINGEVTLQGDDIVAAERLSAACLEAARWCLAAEGTWIGAVARPNGTSYALATGTSFAAPMVAGAMALLAEAFPDLTPHELRLRLLASADNDFAGFNPSATMELAPGFSRAISAEWGHGFLDVKAALLPIGPTTLNLAGGGVHDIAQPLVIEGSATGDAVAQALQGLPVAVSDVFQAGFSVPAQVLVAARDPRTAADLLADSDDGAILRRCCGLGAYFPQSRLFGIDTQTATLGVMVPAEAGTRSGFGMLVGRSFDSALGRASLGFGMAEDSGTLLPRGLAVGQGLSIAGEMELATRIGGKIDLTLAAGYGTTASHRSVAFNSGSVTLGSGGVFSASDQVSLSVGLPVAVAKGQTSLTLPIATRSGAAEFRDISIDLAPPAREIRFGLSYTYRIGDQAGLQASLAHAQNLGHVAGRSGSAAVVGVQVRF